MPRKKKQKKQEPDIKQLTAPCGLDCFNCPAYLSGDNEELRKFVAMRAGVELEDAVCEGCRAQCGQIKLFKATEPCKVYKCIIERGLQFCYECNEFPCGNLQPFADQAQYVPHNFKIFNLCMIKRIGLKEWAEKHAAEIRGRYFNDEFEV